MLISRHTSPEAFAELVGPCADAYDGQYFRDALIAAGFDGWDSMDIPDDQWLDVMNRALESPEYEAGRKS